MIDDEKDDDRVINLGGGECPPGWEALNEVRKIDFSEAHFLDHSVLACLLDGDARAHRFGGVRTHIRYAWEFKWGPELARLTLCKLGHHARTLRSMREDVHSPWVDDIGCANCGVQLQVLKGDDDGDDG